MNIRKNVYDTLEFNNKHNRAPRNMWDLPWAAIYQNDWLQKVKKDYPDDFLKKYPVEYEKEFINKGNMYELGESTDEYGCKFINKSRGIIGEVKNPIIDSDDDEWEDTSKVHLPFEYLSFDIYKINKMCKENDKFVLSPFVANPFERLQYIRGTEELYMDLATEPEGLFDSINKLHAFYCEVYEKWVKTDIDGIFFMDDWGTQLAMLVNPELWRRVFKPLYTDYVKIAHSHGKKAFMHSDGNIMEIIPDLIEIGVDALNSQIFCMGIDNVKQFKGKITFWGEMDRQNVIPFGNKEDVQKLVHSVADNLWQDGGCIAQVEFGPGAKGENVYEAFKTWKEVLDDR